MQYQSVDSLVPELQEELPELEMHAIGHLLPASYFLHYKFIEILFDVNCSPEVSALLTSIDADHS